MLVRNTVVLYLLHQTGVGLEGKPLELKMNFTVLYALQRKPLQEQEDASKDLNYLKLLKWETSYNNVPELRCFEYNSHLVHLFLPLHFSKIEVVAKADSKCKTII